MNTNDHKCTYLENSDNAVQVTIGKATSNYNYGLLNNISPNKLQKHSKLIIQFLSSISNTPVLYFDEITSNCIFPTDITTDDVEIFLMQNRTTVPYKQMAASLKLFKDFFHFLHIYYNYPTLQFDPIIKEYSSNLPKPLTASKRKISVEHVLKEYKSSLTGNLSKSENKYRLRLATSFLKHINATTNMRNADYINCNFKSFLNKTLFAKKLSCIIEDLYKLNDFFQYLQKHFDYDLIDLRCLISFYQKDISKIHSLFHATSDIHFTAAYYFLSESNQNIPIVKDIIVIEFSDFLKEQFMDATDKIIDIKIVLNYLNTTHYVKNYRTFLNKVMKLRNYLIYIDENCDNIDVTCLKYFNTESLSNIYRYLPASPLLAPKRTAIDFLQWYCNAKNITYDYKLAATIINNIDLDILLSYVETRDIGINPSEFKTLISQLKNYFIYLQILNASIQITIPGIEDECFDENLYNSLSSFYPKSIYAAIESFCKSRTHSYANFKTTFNTLCKFWSHYTVLNRTLFFRKSLPIDVKQADITAYLESLPVSPTTLSNYKSVITKFFIFLQDDDFFAYPKFKILPSKKRKEINTPDVYCFLPSQGNYKNLGFVLKSYYNFLDSFCSSNTTTTYYTFTMSFLGSIIGVNGIFILLKQEQLPTIDIYDIEDYLMDVRKNKSESYYKNSFYAIENFVNFLHKFYAHQLFNINYLRPHVSNSKKNTYTYRYDELKSMVNSIDDSFEKALIWTCFEAGLKISELTSLKTKNVNLKARALAVYTADGKLKNKVSLSLDACNFLDTYLTECKQVNQGYYKKSKYLFTNNRVDSSLRIQVAYTLFNKISSKYFNSLSNLTPEIKEEKISNFSSESLRNSIRAYIYAQTFSVEEVKKVTTDSNLYLHNIYHSLAKKTYPEIFV